MKSDVQNYQTAEGLTDEQMASVLTERLGRSISTAGYRIVKGRRDAPREWLEALSIAPQEPGGDGTTGTVTPTPGAPTPSGTDTPPPKPSGVLPFEPRSAHMQITMIYTAAGKGAAMAMQAPPIAPIWAHYAPEIATAYIEWAKESPTVAHWIGVLTLGGPAGNLVSLHASMLVTSLIVANKVKADGLIPPSMRMPEETDNIGGFPDDEELDEPQPAKPRSRK